MADSKKLGKIKQLICCCCGAITKGRQWWNRDKGYGLCPDCINDCHAQGSNDAYGTEGIHYNIKGK